MLIEDGRAATILLIAQLVERGIVAIICYIYNPPQVAGSIPAQKTYDLAYLLDPFDLVAQLVRAFGC